MVRVSSLSKSLLLFALNWVDAHLTIIWIRMNVATEGNVLMARLLDLGEAPFLSVKLTVGAFSAYILYRFAHLPIAKRGMKLVLGLYFALLAVHTATGLSALGWKTPERVLAYVATLPSSFFGLLS